MLDLGRPIATSFGVLRNRSNLHSTSFRSLPPSSSSPLSNRKMSTPAAPQAAIIPPRLAQITSHPNYITDGIPSAASLDPNPLVQFSTWLADASSRSDIIEPEGFSLSTVAVDRATGRAVPSTRILLLKEVDQRGWVFYTNHGSRKGRELFPTSEGGAASEGAYASMAFYWRALHRQVRVVGRVEKVSPAETEAYFHSRPIGSQIGAWASPQSEVLQSREALESAVKDLERRFGVTSSGEGIEGREKGVVPVPPFWGGVRLVPFEVEFWMGRPSRLHDRFRYTREEGSEGAWEIVRLAP